ncbi:hypothetical protein PR048_005770 [Dryococelus australis]|uniref:Uncharacterized protein n=1 Tax=Dryococelus australis TaxID=614101 RepID=A0ABQ9IAC6_9NEOP|nr:hypothetical protein PR048_005770 [Dryococelus australis]
MIYNLYWSSIPKTNIHLWLLWPEKDDQILQKIDFVETLDMCDNTFFPCTHIDDLQHHARGNFLHYKDLDYIYFTVCQKTAWMGWHCP